MFVVLVDVDVVAIGRFTAVLHEDDHNAYKRYVHQTSGPLILQDLRLAQRALHRWGQANSVTSDAGKETFAILSVTDSFGNLFHFLGAKPDANVQMGLAVRACVSQVTWELRTLTRATRGHIDAEPILPFKSPILFYLGYRTPAIYHAARTVLVAIDRVLTSFLRKLDISDVGAFVAFNLAPVAISGDIAMLGLVHRVVLGLGPVYFHQS